MTALSMTPTYPGTLPAGSQLVVSEPNKTLMQASPISFANRRIIVLDGNSGCGKTVALDVLAPWTAG